MAEKGTTDKTPQQIIEELAKENRKLSETVANLQQESQILQQKAQEAILEQKATQQETASVKQQLSTLQQTVAQLQSKNAQLEITAKKLSEQVNKTPLKVLSIEEGSGLINRTIESFSTMKNFKLVDANITLKLATAKLGEEAVLVFPEPGALDPATLHELKLNIRSE